MNRVSRVCHSKEKTDSIYFYLYNELFGTKKGEDV